MKRIALLAVTILVLVSIGLTGGCTSTVSDTKQEDIDNTTPIDEVEPTSEVDTVSDDVVIEMMKRVPDDIREFEFVDVSALRADDNLESLYANWEYEYGWVIKPLGMLVEEVTGFGSAGYTLLIEGDYNLANVRAKLEQQGFETSEYENIEMWSSDDSWMAMMAGFLVSTNEGNGKKFVSVIGGESASLYDSKDFKDVIERLPKGIMLKFKESWFRDSYHYDGIKVSGMSVSKDDKYTMIFTWICKFEDAVSAEKAMPDIESDMIIDEDDNWLNINMAQFKEFVKVTAELEIGDMIN